MTHQQLTDFYNYTGLPFSNEPEDVRVLKKQLLLELKASGGDSLTIASHDYNKNDLIELFDKEVELPSTAWDLEAFLVRFPLMRKILNPESIFLPVDLPAGLRVHPDYHFFKTQEVEPRFERYFQEVQASLKANQLRTVAAQMIFLELFSEERQYKVRSTVKIMLRNKLELIKKSLQRSGSQSGIEEENYFMDPHFYSIIKTVADDDIEFLVHQLHTAEKKIGKERDLHVSKTIYGYQYDLSFPDEIRVQIKANLDRFKKREATFGSSSTIGGSSNKSTGRVIWIVLVVLFFIVRIALKLNRPSHDTAPINMYQNLPPIPQPFTGTDHDDTIPAESPIDPVTIEELIPAENTVQPPPEKPEIQEVLPDSI